MIGENDGAPVAAFLADNSVSVPGLLSNLVCREILLFMSLDPVYARNRRRVLPV